MFGGELALFTLLLSVMVYECRDLKDESMKITGVEAVGMYLRNWVS